MVYHKDISLLKALQINVTLCYIVLCCVMLCYVVARNVLHQQTRYLEYLYLFPSLDINNVEIVLHNNNINHN